MQSDEPIRKLSGVYFSYYKPDKIANLSVVKVHKFKAFDKNGKAIVGGLYDPAMGTSPIAYRSK